VAAVSLISRPGQGNGSQGSRSGGLQRSCRLPCCAGAQVHCATDCAPVASACALLGITGTQQDTAQFGCSAVARAGTPFGKQHQATSCAQAELDDASQQHASYHDDLDKGRAAATAFAAPPCFVVARKHGMGLGLPGACCVPSACPRPRLTRPDPTRVSTGRKQLAGLVKERMLLEKKIKKAASDKDNKVRGGADAANRSREVPDGLQAKSRAPTLLTAACARAAATPDASSAGGTPPGQPHQGRRAPAGSCQEAAGRPGDHPGTPGQGPGHRAGRAGKRPPSSLLRACQTTCRLLVSAAVDVHVSGNGMPKQGSCLVARPPAPLPTCCA